jgi:CO/xanthine dehydrogenase Mo-binding subunit
MAAFASTQALALPDGSRSGLESTYTYDHPMATLPASGSDWGIFAPIVGHAVHIPVVEVDVETGEVAILAYTVVHDCGTVLNPGAVRGQVIGGIAQGIGSALSEQLRYGSDGRLVERDLRSYFMPTSMDVPPIDLYHLETPSPFTWRGVKGVGEGGRMAAPAAIVSAVEDALRPWCVRIDEIPVTPDKILGWLADIDVSGSGPPG